jgi:hypothetical protein
VSGRILNVAIQPLNICVLALVIKFEGLRLRDSASLAGHIFGLVYASFMSDKLGLKEIVSSRSELPFPPHPHVLVIFQCAFSILRLLHYPVAQNNQSPNF